MQPVSASGCVGWMHTVGWVSICRTFGVANPSSALVVLGLLVALCCQLVAEVHGRVDHHVAQCPQLLMQEHPCVQYLHVADMSTCLAVRHLTLTLFYPSCQSISAQSSCYWVGEAAFCLSGAF